MFTRDKPLKASDSQDHQNLLLFSEVPSIKLPRTASYIYNNLAQHIDTFTNTSYYAVINGLEVWIIKHSNSSLNLNSKNTNNTSSKVQLFKVPFDNLDRVSVCNWCKFGSFIAFVIGTQNGFIHIYDYNADKLLFTQEIYHKTVIHSMKNKNSSNSLATKISVNCFATNSADITAYDHQQTNAKLFVGMSNGQIFSFDINIPPSALFSQYSYKSKLQKSTNENISNFKLLTNQKCVHTHKKQIGINCMTNMAVQIVFGLDDGSIIKYNTIDGELEIVLDVDKDIQIPCLCIESCNDFLVAGFANGMMRIIRHSNMSFVMKEIALHRRAITGLHLKCNPNDNKNGFIDIASVSEDGYINVIRDNVSNVQVLKSVGFQNSLLVGVKFVSIDDDSKIHGSLVGKHPIVVVSAYDRQRIVFA